MTLVTQTRVPNLLSAGSFDGGVDSDEWSGSGGASLTLGFPRPGAAQLDAAESLTQSVDLAEDVLYTLHLFFRLATGATLTVTVGDVGQGFVGAPLDVWREAVLVVAPQDAQSDVSFAAAGGACIVDTATLLSGALPISRAQIAAQLAASLAELVADAGLSAAPSAIGPEGDYTYAIDEALRQIGAVNVYGDADVTQLFASEVNDVLDAAQTALLRRLRSKYALETDVTLGPRSERRSQIAGSIDEMLSGGGSSMTIQFGKLTHSDWRR